MAEKKHKTSSKPRKKKYAVFILVIMPAILIVSMFFVLRLGPVISHFRVNTTIVEFGTLETILQVEAVVAREETRYSFPSTGRINWNVVSGEKVGKQQKIADIIVSESDQSMLMEIEMIDMRIQTLESGEEVESFSENATHQLNNRIDHLVSDLSQNVQMNQYELAFKNRYVLEETVQQLKTIQASKDLPEMSIEELKRRKETIQQEIQSQSNEIRAEESGVYSFGSDDLEKNLSVEGLDQEAIVDIFSKSPPDIKSMQENDEYYRIIHQHNWKLIARVPEDYLPFYEVGVRAQIRDIYQQRVIRGTVKDVIESEEGYFVVFKLNQPLEGWHNQRFLEVELIPRKFDGLKVPVSALIEKNGIEGVYRVDLNGYAVFMPTEEIGRAYGTVVVKEGRIELPMRIVGNNQEDEVEMVDTLRRYDQIIVNPENIEEGQRVR
ncbi:HlyD family efflux transporter periplasmic adaptor subunit [Tindallia californiensis]|uniref:HlyD family secretion protein n=1 Tax=Tindallia californiensis TaxID=159292 RepID=A0A1H3JPV4_9FIRM|nr:HlyD family efflux transporter periplasmic adaptor subunit [Tindallia californiensis]SDY41398.1 hypothetical protein SAMN05192546_10246 [Tindallia californiensis]